MHGFGHPFQAPLFPQSIGMGATWDPAQAEAAGAVTGNALRATGWNWDFAPVQDLYRDNRWGRNYETWAEEPALAAALGAAYIRGLQGGGFDSPQVAATVKHFAGYSQSINGHDRVEAQLPIRYLQDIFLPSYAGGIDAGAATVMVDSGSINSIPATASHFLLTDGAARPARLQGRRDQRLRRRRRRWPDDLPHRRRLPRRDRQGGQRGRRRVHDARSTTSAGNTGLIQDVRQGTASRAADRPVGTADPAAEVPARAVRPPVRRPDRGRRGGRRPVGTPRCKAADESITLLRNQSNALPLSPNAKLVVTGPSADSMTNQLGGWSVSWQGVFGAGHVCCMGPPDQIPPGTTVLKGLQAADPNVVSAPDQAVRGRRRRARPTRSSSSSARRRTPRGSATTRSPALPPDQKALISALQATGKPVIVVVIAGRPLGLGPGARQRPARS